MSAADIVTLRRRYVTEGDQADYTGLIRELAAHGRHADPVLAGHYTAAREQAYAELARQLVTHTGPPASPVSFGTSGWRGILGRDLFCRSVAQVTQAIVSMYLDLETLDEDLRNALGVASVTEARERGCLVGHDNRFGGAILAAAVCEVLTSAGFTVHYAGEATTGTLSAALLQLGAAFSINLTPSHNPLEYGGFKYNAADGGPAATVITREIGRRARAIIDGNLLPPLQPNPSLVRQVDVLALWQHHLRQHRDHHGLDYDEVIQRFLADPEIALVIDCVHGASRVHVSGLFHGQSSPRLAFLRAEPDPTFGGIAPEPSWENLAAANGWLQQRPEPLKLGAIIDPDADRIRFTDGNQEISMNQFGALAFHYLHEVKGKRGLLAKTVATSNFANAVAAGLQAEVFETAVGFKNFKPVIGRALVCFEESDGITVAGHTPEKDAYIGLVLALDMLLSRRQNLTAYLEEVSQRYGAYFPDRGGVTVSETGEGLRRCLARLDRLQPGTSLAVGGKERTVSQLITVDGHKVVLDDGSWLMIRPSGTEPKVRFYVEARSPEDRGDLLAAARHLLAECGLDTAG